MATPKRTDGLEKILYWYFGDIMYKMENTKNDNVLVNIIKYNLEHDKFKEYYLKSGDVNRPKTFESVTKVLSAGCGWLFVANIFDLLLSSGKLK